MAFLGKEYKMVKQEKYGEFLKVLGFTDDKVQAYMSVDNKEKIVKNGDSYTLVYNSPGDSQEVSFKPGVEIEEPLEDGVTVKSTYNIDGNTINQIVKTGDSIAKVKREYSGNDLVMTMTSDKWDGVARIYYKA